MQTRKDRIRGKIIKSCISKSCGFSQWKALFLDKQNLLVTILQIHLPAQARAMTLSLVQFIPPSPEFLLSFMSMKSGMCGQPTWSAGHDPPMTSSCIYYSSSGLFHILLMIASNIPRAGFFRGLPQLCYTCTSASDNQSSFHSSAAPESTPTFFFSPWVQPRFIQQERA